MVSREQKRAAAAAVLQEKLQLLGSITNSHAMSKTSIIVGASDYTEELKQKVERVNRDMVLNAQSTSTTQNTLPVVNVETLEKGFEISVYSGKNCRGLLVFILEAFEELGLNVLEARVSCKDSFRLQAVGEENEEQREGVHAETVKQAVLLAVKNWGETDDVQD